MYLIIFLVFLIILIIAGTIMGVFFILNKDKKPIPTKPPTGDGGTKPPTGDGGTKPPTGDGGTKPPTGDTSTNFPKVIGIKSSDSQNTSPNSSTFNDPIPTIVWSENGKMIATDFRVVITDSNGKTKDYNEIILKHPEKLSYNAPSLFIQFDRKVNSSEGLKAKIQAANNNSGFIDVSEFTPLNDVSSIVIDTRRTPNSGTSPAPPPPPPPPPPLPRTHITSENQSLNLDYSSSKRIEVTGATYGYEDTNFYSLIDVKSTVQNLFNQNKKLSIQANTYNNIFGDPAPGKTKTLIMNILVYN